MKILFASSALLVSVLAGQSQAQFATNQQTSTSFTTLGTTFAVGGSDSCATPDVITGTGTYSFDNTIAVTGVEGQVECGSINDDVWFEWTAPSTGIATVNTCAGASFDTKLAAYPGTGCPVDGSSLDCNDDSCGLQSSISFTAVSGSVYTIQVGTFSAGQGGPGTFDIAISTAAGNDDCATPYTIAGQGTFGWDSTAASTGIEGQIESLCDFFGSTNIDNDVWYTWTADQDGIALISTCGTAFDTKAAAYAGIGCPTAGASIACNDDARGLQSTISFHVVNGGVYTLQLGNYLGVTGGIGTMNISILTPPPEGVYQYDTGDSTIAGSLGLTAGGALGWLHSFDSGGSDLITEISSAFGTPNFPGITPGAAIEVCIWDDVNNDGDPSDAALLYQSSDVSSLEDTDTLIAFAVPSIAVTGKFFVGIVHDGFAGDFPAPMDSTFPSLGRAWVVGNTAGIGAFDFANLLNNDVAPVDIDVIGFPAVWLLRAVGTDGLGTNYCTSAPNSTGSASVISAAGSLTHSDADLTLTASNAPAGQPGVFFFADNQVSVPFGNGTLCVGGSITGMAAVFETAGEYTYTVPFGTYGGAIATDGSATNFQMWYRDPVAGGAFFNTSDGLELIFMP